MKFYFHRCIIIGCLVALAVHAHAQLANDGITTDGLAKLVNRNGTGDTLGEISKGDGGSLQAGLILEGAPSFAVRHVWYSRQFQATNESYTVSAEFKPAAVETQCRGGVMGFLDAAGAKGIAFYARPAGATASFRAATIDFNAEVGNDNESVNRLFNLDGSSATFAFDSAASELGNYDPSKTARFTLQFSAPTASERTALPAATARITAFVEQTNETGASVKVGRSIELLTDLEVPAPLDHRFGYFAYWGSLSGAGVIGHFDNLRASGSVVPSANQPPKVLLTKPLDTVDAIAPATIVLSAEASDADGAIARVEFLDGTNLIATVQAPPYAIAWTNIQAGSYEIRARAIDDLGAATTSTNSTLVFVENNVPPSVSLLKPSVNSSFKAPALVEIEATASDIDGRIAKMEFFGNGILLASLTGPPYLVSWDLRTPGVNKLFVRATDDRGATNQTPELIITALDNLAPKALVTSPTDGATFKAPANIRITANVSDSDGQVVQAIAFYNIHEQIAVVSAPVGGALPPVVSFDWNNVPEGRYIVDVVAIDHQGIRTTSPPIEVIVTPGGGTGGSGPVLQITPQADSMILTWPATQTGFRLQGSPTLLPAEWVEITSSNNRATVPANGNSRYFRLIKP